MATFGTATVGPEHFAFTNSIQGTIYHCTTSETALKITVYLFGGLASGERVRAAIYDASGNLVAETAEIIGPVADGTWLDLPFDNPPLLSVGNYMLVVWSNGTDSPCMGAFDVDYAVTSVAFDLAYTGTFPTVLSGYEASVWKWSMYCTTGTIGPTPPTADFVIDSVNLRTVNVHSTSVQGSAAIVSYDWNWGDGTHGTGSTASHMYSADGDYAIILTVTDANNLSDASPSQIVHASTATPPTASFTWVQTANTLAVVFTSTSTPGNTYPITGYEWDFGDGTPIGTGQTTSHTYALSGSYDVVLRVTDTGGGWDDVVQTITVAPVAVTIYGTTPWDSAVSYPALETGSYQITVPASVTVGGKIYNFVQWEDGSTNPVRTFTLSGDMTISATYAESQYTLTIVPSTGGTTNPPSGTQNYTAGQTAVVTANPTAGYSFTNWLLDGSNAGTSNPISIVMNANHTLTPVFTYNPVYYTLTINSATGGATSPSAGTTSHLAGTEVVITALPATGNEFAYWTVDYGDGGTANPLRITMNANHTVQPVFQEIRYTLAITSTVGGTTTPSGSATYVAGEVVQVTASPTGSYLFDHWVLDGADAGTTNTISVTMNTNHTLQAVFVQGPTMITLNVVAGVGGSVFPSGPLQLTVGQSYQFNAVESTGYDFLNWDLAGENKGSTPSIILNITAAMSGQILTARFTTEPPPKVTITLAIAGNGTTDIAPGTQILNVGDTITITAIPQSGATFNGWLLDSVPYSADNPLQLTVTADLNGKTLTADFTAPIPFPIWLLIPIAGVLVVTVVAVRGGGKKSRR